MSTTTTTDSQLVEVEIPTQTRTVKSRFDTELLDAAAKKLGGGKTVNLHGGLPLEDRASAQVSGWYARQELARHMDIDAKALRSRTFPVDGGFSYGVFLRDEDSDES